MRRTSKTSTLRGIKALRRTDQTNIAFFDQVRQRHATVVVVLADGHHETKVGSNQPILGFMATIIDDGPSQLAALRAASKDWCDQSPVGNARVLHGFWTCWPSQDRVILHHIRRNPRLLVPPRNQSGEEVALSNAEANLFGNRWGKLYERNKRNWIPTGDFVGDVHWQDHSFRQSLVATASVTPSAIPSAAHQLDGWESLQLDAESHPTKIRRSGSKLFHARPQFC